MVPGADGAAIGRIGTDPIVLTRTALAATGQLTDLRFRV
jgi:hypothetical protein